MGRELWVEVWHQSQDVAEPPLVLHRTAGDMPHIPGMWYWWKPNAWHQGKACYFGSEHAAREMANSLRGEFRPNSIGVAKIATAGMLVLSRKLGEKIFIGENICITVVDIDRGRIRLGIEAPPDVPIYRHELLPVKPPEAGGDLP